MKSYIAATVGAALITLSAQAVCFTPDTYTGPFDGNTPTGEIYKFDLPSTESGSAAGLFESELDGSGVKITFTGAAGERPDLTFLAIKASNAYTLWDMSEWYDSGLNCIYVENNEILNRNQIPHDISHVSLYGGTHEVPDAGSSLALLGLGLGALAFRRRK